MEINNINMPLLGDSFPEIKVQTTHGPMNIPDDLKGSWFVYIYVILHKGLSTTSTKSA